VTKIRQSKGRNQSQLVAATSLADETERVTGVENLPRAYRVRHLGRRDEMTGTPYLSKHPPSPDKYALTDHMVRPEENGWRDCEGESLRGLQVDDQLELAALLHRQVGRLGALRISGASE